MDLRQKGSVIDYAQRFQLLMLEIPDMSKADCLFHFYRGLKPHVRVHTEMSRPTTLRAAVEAADVADSTLYHIGAHNYSLHIANELIALYQWSSEQCVPHIGSSRSRQSATSVGNRDTSSIVLSGEQLP